MGTKSGAKKAVATIYAKFNQDFFRRVGAVGGSRCVPKGFSMNREAARRSGQLGGRISRRGPNKLSPEQRRKIRREVEKAYKELLATHTKAQRADEGAILVFDRKRGLVHQQVA